MNTYFIRSLKYLGWLLGLFLLILVVMILTGTSNGNGRETFAVLFGTRQGVLMLAAIVILALLYPSFGFTKRDIPCPDPSWETIKKAFHTYGYSATAEADDELIFKADSVLKKMILLGEDKITVARTAQGIRIEGLRKEIVKMEVRLRRYFQECNLQ